MKYLWITLAGKTGTNEKDRKRPMSPEKNWIVLNVEPIASAFKVNVLHRAKPLPTPFDYRSRNNRKNLPEMLIRLSPAIADGLYTSSPFVHRSSAFGWSATRPSTLHSEPPQ
ncbi:MULTISPECIES: hypothetical protein [Pseudomonas]|uniref:Uncharacterized protein n=1 Tax=Pseudomonas monachiensis TaxID=3060212 RepID=A0ABW9HCZ7_9PSED|nr:hypothetical protein [Pseudomonas sp. BF-RE-26]